jgi:hypothetical protein
MSSSSFDSSDLVRAWLSQREYRNAHADLKAYHEAALEAFSKAFGICLEIPPENKEGFPDENGLHGLFLQVVRSYESTLSPFASYMCGTQEISEMYQKYGEPLEAAAASLRALHLKMMVELVERIWGGDMPHRVSQQELHDCGYPSGTAPDPVDYW